MTLKEKVKAAFPSLTWPADDTQAIPLRGAAIQCKTDHEVGCVCDIVRNNPDLAKRNAKLLVYLLTVAGMPETDSDKWIAAELRAAKVKARRSVKVVSGLKIELTITKMLPLITLHIVDVYGKEVGWQPNVPPDPGTSLKTVLTSLEPNK